VAKLLNMEQKFKKLLLQRKKEYSKLKKSHVREYEESLDTVAMGGVRLSVPHRLLMLNAEICLLEYLLTT